MNIWFLLVRTQCPEEGGRLGTDLLGDSGFYALSKCGDAPKDSKEEPAFALQRL